MFIVRNSKRNDELLDADPVRWSSKPNVLARFVTTTSFLEFMRNNFPTWRGEVELIETTRGKVTERIEL